MKKQGQTTDMNLFEQQQNEFQQRHIGPDEHETAEMLKTIGKSSMEELINKTIPSGIRLDENLKNPSPQSEYEYLQELKKKWLPVTRCSKLI